MFGKITAVDKKFPGNGETLIYVAFEDTFKKDNGLKQLGKKINNKLLQHEFSGKEGELVSVDVDHFYKTIIIVGAGKEKEFSLIKWRNLLADTFRYCCANKLTNVTVSHVDLLKKDYFEIGKNLAVALYLTNYDFDFYKSEEAKKKIKRITNLDFQSVSSSQSIFKSQFSNGVKYGILLAEGVCLTRDLVNQPAAHVHPDTLEDQALQIAKESKGKITVEVLDENECRKLGMEAYLGVAAGSEQSPKFIILHYSGSLKNSKQVSSIPPICLIGKSITFDSGGLSLKPSEHMETMKMDMAGGATVLGVFKILAHTGECGININAEISGILPACENMPSGHAMRPGDIVTALNGKSIEVLKTDAEGRLTLADALSYAEKYLQPAMIIDLATLTGACIVALGKNIAGMFGNDQKMLDNLEKAANTEGEELWPMPLHKYYAKSLKSPIADLKNIGGGKYSGGAITAALFLSDFVDKAKWIHLDIAGPAFNDNEPYGVVNRGGTGWGILTLMSFLRQSPV